MFTKEAKASLFKHPIEVAKGCLRYARLLNDAGDYKTAEISVYPIID